MFASSGLPVIAPVNLPSVPRSSEFPFGKSASLLMFNVFNASGVNIAHP